MAGSEDLNAPADIDAQQAEADLAAAAALADAAPDTAAPEPNPDAERTAKLMGWKPLDQWKGDPANWRPAEDFLAEVPEVLRHTRKANQRLEEKFAKVVGEVAKLTKVQERQMAASTEQRLRDATEANDFEAVKAIMAERDAMRAAEPSEPAAFTAFKDRNAAWFGIDAEASAYAEALDNHLARTAGGLDKVTDLNAHMRSVEAGVKKRFPELFDAAPARETPKAPLVNRGGRTESRRASGELTEADLTPVQRRAAEDMGVSLKGYVTQLNKINAREKANA